MTAGLEFEQLSPGVVVCGPLLPDPSICAEREFREEAQVLVATEAAGEGSTSSTLDRVHQAMVPFAAGRGDALKRFLVEGGVGRAATF